MLFQIYWTNGQRLSEEIKCNQFFVAHTSSKEVKKRNRRRLGDCKLIIVIF